MSVPSGLVRRLLGNIPGTSMTVVVEQLTTLGDQPHWVQQLPLPGAWPGGTLGHRRHHKANQVFYGLRRDPPLASVGLQLFQQNLKLCIGRLVEFHAYGLHDQSAWILCFLRHSSRASSIRSASLTREPVVATLRR